MRHMDTIRGHRLPTQLIRDALNRGWPAGTTRSAAIVAVVRAGLAAADPALIALAPATEEMTTAVRVYWPEDLWSALRTRLKALGRSGRWRMADLVAMALASGLKKEAARVLED